MTYKALDPDLAQKSTADIEKTLDLFDGWSLAIRIVTVAMLLLAQFQNGLFPTAYWFVALAVLGTVFYRIVFYGLLKRARQAERARGVLTTLLPYDFPHAARSSFAMIDVASGLVLCRADQLSRLDYAGDFARLKDYASSNPSVSKQGQIAKPNFEYPISNTTDLALKKLEQPLYVSVEDESVREWFESIRRIDSFESQQ